MRYFTIPLCVLFLILSSFGAVHAFTLELIQADKTKLPEGPSPANFPKNKRTNVAYAPSMAQTFTFEIKGLQTREYYRASATLTRSNYDGFAANFPKKGKKYKDLAFLRSDYTTSGWEYESDTTLSFDNEGRNYDPPGSIVIRCYDWGASGTLNVKIQRKTGVNEWVNVGGAAGITQRIPFDENENGIADAWEKSHGYKILSPNNVKNLTGGEDNEKVPADNPALGDGWSVYNEYRGLFLQPTDTSVKRLNPKKKDVMVCSSDDLVSHGTGSVSIPHHVFEMIHEDFVNDPWAAVHDKKVKARMKAKVSKDIGWINFNAKDTPGGDIRAWAMRLVVESNTTKLGDMPTGSPSYYSKGRIYKNGIEREIRDIFRDNQVQYKKNGKKTQDFLGAVDVLIKLTISHEIGHSLDISHCQHANCLMRPGDDHDIRLKKKTMTLSHDTTGIDADHDTFYAATGVIGPDISDCGMCSISSTEDEVGSSPDPAPTPTTTLHACGLHTSTASGDHTTSVCNTSPCSNRVYWNCVYAQCPESSSHGTTTITPAMHVCGSHQAWQSGDHSWITPPCGDVTHAMYACQVDSDHSMQVVSCSVTNSNGDTCTVTNYYVCQYHTHSYPAPVISCGRSGCTQAVSSATEHQHTCAAGHTYWTCGEYANWLFHHHRVLTCKFTSCQQTWQTCNPNTPKPMCRAASRQGEKCWALPASQ